MAYRQTVDAILRVYHKKPKDVDVELQTIQLIETAARLLKNEIIENVTDIQEVYPSAEDLNKDDSFQYPNSLRLLLTKLFACKEKDKIRMKISAIGQALIQAARPRTVLTPLQLGLAVLMHHHFQSKYLIESQKHVIMEDLRVKGLRREVAQNRAEWRSATT